MGGQVMGKDNDLSNNSIPASANPYPNYTEISNDSLELG